VQQKSDIDALVVERFCQPLAVAWKRAVDKVGTDQEFKAWRRAGELLVRTLALLAVADFMRGAESDDVDSALMQLDNPNIALWVHLLDSAVPVLQEIADRESLFPELLESYGSSEDEANQFKSCLYLIFKLDDVIVGGSAHPSICDSYRQAVRGLAEHASWLASYDFVHLGSFQVSKDGGWGAEIRSFRGAGPPGPPRRIAGSESRPHPGVYAYDEARGRLVALSAFFRYLAGSGFASEGLYVFQETWQSQVLYKSPLDLVPLFIGYPEELEWLPLGEILEDTGTVVDDFRFQEAPRIVVDTGSAWVPMRDSRSTDALCRYWLPHPLADLYWLSRSCHEPLERYFQALYLVEGCLRFLVLACLADALAREHPPDRAARWLDHLRHPTLGKLHRILGEISAALVRADGPFINELADLHQSESWRNALERICRDRNDLAHHRKSVRKGAVDRLYRELTPDLRVVLQALSFMAEYQLGVADGVKGEAGQVEFRWSAAIGPRPFAEQVRLASTVMPPTDRPLLLDTRSGHALVLEPWLRVCELELLGDEESMLWFDRVEEGTTRYRHWSDQRLEYPVPGFPPERMGRTAGIIDLHVEATSLRRLRGPQLPEADLEGYTLVGLLGRGGMSEVWEALDGNGQRMAIKLLHEQLAMSRSSRRRFENEGKTLARFVDHPGIVSVYHPRQTCEGVPFLPMELIEGEDLRRRMERLGPFELEEAVDILGQILGLLQHIHDHGVFHRDVKPSNFMLTARGVVMIDLGIAAREDGERLTGTMDRMGSLGFMAPEVQARPKARPTAQVDIYGAGALFWALLKGHAPVDGFYAHLDEDLGETPYEVREVIRGALARRPEQRFASAAAMSSALEDSVRRAALRASRGPFLLLVYGSERGRSDQWVLFPEQPVVLGSGELGVPGIGLDPEDLDAAGVSGDFVLFSTSPEGGISLHWTDKMKGQVTGPFGPDGVWMNLELWEFTLAGDERREGPHELPIWEGASGHVMVGASVVMFVFHHGRAPDRLDAFGLVALSDWTRGGGRVGPVGEEE
jgi:hypothetical protein